MKNKVQGEKQLVAKFFSNIGVAWFTSGVIGIFVGQKRNSYEYIYSISWGLLFSFIFLFMGVQLMKKKL